jgi:cation diffusion facilitator CzcD-associated flavoprotein CzcO
VGAGFGGLGAAIRLEREGFRDFAVLERGAEVGGTWWFNDYPGCQCDVPSNLYSFSFAPKTDWSRSYPEQPEILDYLKDCSHRYGVRDRIYLACELIEARWAEDEDLWRIETSRGPLSARFLVSAPGLLSEPKTPDIPGLDSFGGETVHTARWGADRDLAASGSRWSARARRPCSSCPACSPRSSGCTCSSAPRRGSCRCSTGR